MSKIDSLIRIKTDKAAIDHGFDLTPQEESGWLRYRSTLFTARVWIRPSEGGRFQVGCDDARLLKEASRGHEYVEVIDSRPVSMAATVEVPSYSKLYKLLDRIAALAQSLPVQILEHFVAATREMPKTTEAERLVIQRIGQSMFREGLIKYWDGRCAVTGFNVLSLLRASHIKPWAKCANDHERLDVYNGFLLAPQLDAMFDDGWCTFTDEGCLVLSPELDSEQLQVLGIRGEMKLSWITDEHRKYLRYHRTQCFTDRNR